MATTRVVQVLHDAQTIIQDKTGVRWPLSELLRWFNLAQLAVVAARPDACARNESFTAVLGTKQVLPAEGLRLIDIPRNETGTMKPIRRIEKKVLDDQLDWHDPSSPQPVVQHYVYDDRDPKTFYLFPAPAAGVKVLLVYSVAPAAIEIANFENDAKVVALDDVYCPPILDYILYRAYSKDAEYAGNTNRAMAHLQSFNNALGVKMSADQVMSPNATA